jgi:hypothetical protein
VGLPGDAPFREALRTHVPEPGAPGQTAGITTPRTPITLRHEEKITTNSRDPANRLISLVFPYGLQGSIERPSDSEF